MAMSLNIEGAKRADMFSIPPENIVIPGLDTNDEVSIIQRARIKKPVSEADIANVMMCGVLEPVLLEKVDANTFKLLDGMQRVKRARLANERLKKAGGAPLLVNCVIEKNVDELRRYAVQISANKFRSDVEDRLEAEQAWTLINVNKLDVKDVATMFGRTPQTIGNWLKEHGFSGAVKEAVASGEIPKTAARAIASNPEAAAKAPEIIAEAKKIADNKSGPKRKGRVSVTDMKKAIEKVVPKGPKTLFDAPSKQEVRAILASSMVVDAPNDAIEMAMWMLGDGPEPKWVTEGKKKEQKKAG